MRRRRGIMGLNGGAGIPVITATATGNPLTFETDLARPLKSLVIPFTPIQAAGTPSPDNILPISGWTNVTLKRNTGPNIWDEEWENGDYNMTTGGKIVNGSKVRCKNFIPVNPNTNYYAVAPVKLNAYYYNANKVLISSNISPGIQGRFTTPQNCYYMTFSTFGSTYTVYQNNISINYPRTETAYHSYLQPVLSITFTDPTTGDPLTVYGGTVTLNEDGSVDVVNGRIIVTYDGDEDWGKSGAYYYVRTSSSYNVQQVPVSNLFLGVSNRPFRDLADLEFAMTQNDMSYINIRYDAMTSLDAFKELLSSTPMIVAYERKYPITYHFDDVGQLITFVGTNTIWTDTNGTNTATYLKHQS